MARKKKDPAPTPTLPELDANRHHDTRKNIPTEELCNSVSDDEVKPSKMLDPRDPSLDLRALRCTTECERHQAGTAEPEPSYQACRVDDAIPGRGEGAHQFLTGETGGVARKRLTGKSGWPLRPWPCARDGPGAPCRSARRDRYRPRAAPRARPGPAPWECAAPWPRSSAGFARPAPSRLPGAARA